ncbi:hypothetical protein EON63_19270 [archaeon]|nr:MAG: hypothetical protein EON63_19270 [archaeon]
MPCANNYPNWHIKHDCNTLNLFLPLDFTVIDVRDEIEYSNGHIKGAESIPSTQFADPFNASKILESHLGQKTIVVHCAKSQHRGPACARALQSALDKLVAERGDEVDKTQLPKM